MSFTPLPRAAPSASPFVPPLKSQGIKTKLLPFILANIRWDGRGVWREPFLGSGAVLFNVTPPRAVVGDANPHIVTFYRAVQSGRVTPDSVARHLDREGRALREEGAEHYYAVRARFNAEHDPLDFLFLNRSCFNGVMRFNRKGEFNVPFCRKPERFRQALRTRIVNQVRRLAEVMKGRDWELRTGDWRSVLGGAQPDDFVYLDPPYIGRHADYFKPWSEDDAVDLSRRSRELGCGVALSMWRKNRFRTNDHLDDHWQGMVLRSTEHFYHVGSRESLRHAMEEALVIAPGWEAPSRPD